MRNIAPYLFLGTWNAQKGGTGRCGEATSTGIPALALRAFFWGCLSGLGCLSSSCGVSLFAVLGLLFFSDFVVLFYEILVPTVAVGGDGDEFAGGRLVVDVGGLL